MTSGVYAITNTWNGHRYIGSAVDMGRRQGRHRYDLRRGTHVNPHLQAAWAKYRESAFRFTVLEECKPEGLIAAEQSWMDALQPEYNVAPTAGSCLGKRCSKETRAKMSAAGMGHVGWTKGKKMPPEVCAKVSAAKKGRPNGLLGKKRPNHSATIMGHEVSQETRDKIAVSNMGKRHSISAATRQKMSADARIMVHRRWHVNRGIVNPECKLCKAANP